MQMIRRNIELETRLIDDLLDLSRITSGKLSLRLEVVDLNESMEHVCEICRPQILEKGLHLHKDLDSRAGPVRVDSSRLQQVFWNVLKNAAKFTPEGGDIHVSTRRVKAGVVEVVVKDTGAGIPADNLPKIFNAFEQGDAGVTRQFGGLGLGLAISKALVELHGGTIRVESDGAGKGSVFTIELPAIEEPLPEKPNPAAESKRPSPGSLKLLVVEDHADTANMLALLLRATGHRVETATTVADALHLAASHRFDLLISDVGLPDGTGYELMKILQSTRALRGIAMSGFGSDEDMRKSYAAGFSDHLVKPVNFAVLEHTIRRVMDRNE
jgi:CheY-like chemotaxis protein